jgi:chromosome segregation ATPase
MDKIDKLELERRLEKLRADLQEKRRQVVALQDELGAATAASYAAEKGQKKGNVGKIRKALQTAQNEVAAMKAAIPILERQVLTAKIEAIREQIGHNNDERAEWGEKHAELRAAWLETLDAADAAQAKVARVQAEINDLRDDNRLLSDQLAELGRKLNPAPAPADSPPVIEMGIRPPVG